MRVYIDPYVIPLKTAAIEAALDKVTIKLGIYTLLLLLLLLLYG